MLNLHRIKQLADHLSVDVKTLVFVAERVDDYCEELIMLDPARPDKKRNVLNITGRFRVIQQRLHERILRQRLTPSIHSFGGVPKRHIKNNAEVHVDSHFALTVDLSNFYPSISHHRVYRLFHEQLRCHTDVARVLTKLCTYKHHLALGLVTSPILADRIFLPADRQLAEMSRVAKLAYSRFVDDLTFSAQYDLSPESAGILGCVTKIIHGHGFKLNDKTEYGALENVSITKLRIRRGRVDVNVKYLAEVERQISDAARLSRDGPFTGPFYTQAQIRGRTAFISWINPGRRLQLLRQQRAVNWNQHAFIAQQRGLIVQRKRLVRAAESDTPKG